MFVVFQIWGLPQPILNEVTEGDIDRDLAMLSDELPVSLWLCEEQYCLAQPVKVWLMFFEALQRITSYFTAKSTHQSLKGIAVHDKLEVVLEGVDSLGVIAVEEGLHVLC